MKADSDGVKADNLYNFNHSHMNEKYGFPAWYLRHKNDSTKDALGFCQVMRKDRELSVGKMIKDQVKYTEANLPDLPDLIFGYLGTDDSSGLGSRVGFSDLRSVGTPEVKSREYVLGEPKPTFYPLYLGKFEHKKQYEKDSLIAGRKLYKIRDQFKLADPKFPNENQKVRTAVDFASEGNVFKGSIVFHNLKPEELGALLWVMSFGEGIKSETSGYYHALGHAKSMGAGAVKFILNNDSIDVPQYMIEDGRIVAGGFSCEKSEIIAKCIDKFKELMNFNYPFAETDQYSVDDGKWGKSVIITSYLNNAQEDHKALQDKVYNEFPDEFECIKKDYENSPDAKDYKGSYPDGKKFGDAYKSFNEEKKWDSKHVNSVVNEREKNRQKIEEEARKKEEKAMEASRQKNAAISGYSDVVNSGNLVKIFAFAIANPGSKDLFEKDVASGKISKNWKFGTFNQLLKSISADPDYKDENSLFKAADDIISVVAGNSDAETELKKAAKDGRKKSALMKYIYEKLEKKQ